jgi:hypothetical protein
MSQQRIEANSLIVNEGPFELIQSNTSYRLELSPEGIPVFTQKLFGGFEKDARGRIIDSEHPILTTDEFLRQAEEGFHAIGVLLRTSKNPVGFVVDYSECQFGNIFSLGMIQANVNKLFAGIHNADGERAAMSVVGFDHWFLKLAVPLGAGLLKGMKLLESLTSAPSLPEAIAFLYAVTNEEKMKIQKQILEEYNNRMSFGREA